VPNGKVLNTQSLQILHCVRIDRLEILIAQVNVLLGEYVAIAIVIAVPSQLVCEVLSFCEYPCTKNR
jgi:hypothetical protein